MKSTNCLFLWIAAAGSSFLPLFAVTAVSAAEFPKPYDKGCTERENVFAFTKKPTCRYIGNDKYEIAFAVKGYCDVTVGLVDGAGKVVRHLASGVLGKNAPPPFQKNALAQKIYWNGKDDLSHYPKEPGKLRLRVMLGLKPVFDKSLGGTSPHNIPGRIKGLTVSPEGAFVFSMGGRSKLYIRKYDRDGNYVMSLVSQPSNLPEKKLQGMGYVEYEKGKRTLHGTDLYQSIADHMRTPISTIGKRLREIQPVVVKNRLYFSNTGEFGVPSAAYYMYTDGSTDLTGISGRPLVRVRRGLQHVVPRFCASPDGKWLYLTGVGDGRSVYPCVYRFSWSEKGTAKPWVGDPGRVGHSNKRLNNPQGIACDAKGRVYVADSRNNRVQVFSPQGKLVKSISITNPFYLCVHPRTGAVYVQHNTRVNGRTVRRTVKLRSVEDPKVVASFTGAFGAMELDCWSAKPRLWYSNTNPHDLGLLGTGVGVVRNSISVWEDEGTSFKKVMDFDEMSKREDGKFYAGRWGGSALGTKMVCDPTRETVLVGNRRLFDLRTGLFSGGVRIPAYSYDDMAYDKHGRLHVHLNPGFDKPGVIRVDPAQAKLTRNKDGSKSWYYPEMPYDYGVEIPGKYCATRVGALPVKDQRGAKFFQDGLGVNMRGEVAEECNIYYVPKMDNFSRDFLQNLRGKLPPGAGGRFPSYARYRRKIQDREKRGEKVYYIKREPGLDLAGGTIWTFEWTGELMTETAVVAGGLINGTQMDEDGNLYFVIGVSGRTRLVDGKAWLTGKGGWYGKTRKMTPFTGTLVKSAGQKFRLRWNNSPLQMSPLPTRPPDVGVFPGGFGGGGAKGWAEGAAWLYAGASPIVSHGCSCPTQRLHLDWFKRAYVPEQYRHSIGILDTAGNLIMHLGRYGNYDDVLRLKKGDTSLPLSAVRFVSGTDNYLCFEDNGERLTVLKLEYHAEETVPVRMR